MTTNKEIDSAPTSLAPRPMRLRVDTQAEDVRVEIIPLIDVIFCILIFFILAAVGFSRQQAINIDLPKAGTGTPQGRDILVVSLTDAGQVFVEQQPVATKDQFYQKLRDYRQQNPNGLMALYASTNATYNQVVQVLDLLREVGGDRVALATLPAESGGIPNATPSLPPTMGVPGVPPAPGTNSFDPYGLQNPATQFNPAQPQVPPNPGQPLPGLPGTNPGQPLPGLPGTNPSNLQPLPGQPGTNPGTSAVPSPGATAAPNTTNAAPTQTQPGNPPAPSSGTTTAPNTTRTNNATPGR
ncbi:MAG: biopolymer transporter ExbD [Cyanobacteriota bacterium]|nr:biopolymer transporter ExbD [Cyanobacteriota bacterium]